MIEPRTVNMPERLDAMKVGAMLKVSGVSLSTINSAMWRMRKRTGKHFTAKTLPDETIGVWRKS